MIKHRHPPVDEKLRLQAVDRVIDVLECFSEPPSHKTLGEIAGATGISKTVIQRIGRTLVGRGYLAQDDDGRLHLGPMLLERSYDFIRLNPLIERASPILLDLHQETGQRIDLSLFDPLHDNLSIVYALRLQGKREALVTTLPGRRLPAASNAGGRACMAHLPDATINEIISLSDLRRRTPMTILEPAEIRARIGFCRAHGYCLTVEEIALGDLELAAAVLDRNGAPVAAIHIGGALSTWSEAEFCERFAPLAMSTAQAISG